MIPENYEIIVEVGWNTQENGRRKRVTSSRRQKTRRPSETVVSCGDQRPGMGSEGHNLEGRKQVKERKTPQKRSRRDVENAGDTHGRRKDANKRRVLLQYMSTQDIFSISRKQIRTC